MEPSEETQEPDYRFTLANERTFLAWIRTALALIAGGVAVVQLVPAFGIPGLRHGSRACPRPRAAALLAVLAVRRWQHVQAAMRRGADLPPSTDAGDARGGHPGGGDPGSSSCLSPAMTEKLTWPQQPRKAGTAGRANRNCLGSEAAMGFLVGGAIPLLREGGPLEVGRAVAGGRGGGAGAARGVAQSQCGRTASRMRLRRAQGVVPAATVGVPVIGWATCGFATMHRGRPRART